MKPKAILPILFLALSTLLAFVADPNEMSFVKQHFSASEKQLGKLLDTANRVDTLYPRTIDQCGKVIFTNMYEWTSGFFAGSLWYGYEGTGNPQLKAQAIKWTEKLEPLKSFTEHHDLGFMVYCSYGNAYRMTKNEKYKDILVQAAQSLSTRFSEKTGVIKSWDKFGSWDGKGRYDFPVIIDNMMNLELLFFASKVTGNQSYREIALSHAEKTMQNQIRDDYSSYHVVCYDPQNGKVLSRETAQGYANNSTWARGQSWGIYGFTMTYRETQDPRYLKVASKMADYYIDHSDLPSDFVAYWDFNANQNGYTPSIRSKAKDTPTNYRDASAAAVTASALLELSTFSGINAKKYRDAGVKILKSLSGSAYFAKYGTNGGFLLRHSVGSIAHGVEIDVPLVYADYYYLEALNRYRKILSAA
ncbi:glycoside hydrolase family 88 protein [Pedobacter nanyangensis]|uniref:glycoside hydrolase family 88 protein n=1 Tax=Pedobacter nanyangensis TaxID=1562389 RepID=UPI000DE25493|nr:glycoside hydrolase family 88 protein [Pedobacter nanyangensis]